MFFCLEIGAFNEALSGLFTALLKKLKGQCDDPGNNHINDAIWKIREDVYTMATAGNTLRYMYDPQEAGDYDYYPNRYQGTSDNGGVHSNSGITNSDEYD